MPVTKQAIKKVRQDARKTAVNLKRKKTYKKAVRDYLKNPTVAGLSIVFTALDRAAKTNVIHRNKAARLKSRLSKKLASVKSVSKPTPTKKKSKSKSK